MFKAIRTICDDPRYVEWVHILEDGEIATSSIPEFFPMTCSITGLVNYWGDIGKVFNPQDVPIEMVVVNIYFPQFRLGIPEHDDKFFIKNADDSFTCINEKGPIEVSEYVPSMRNRLDSIDKYLDEKEINIQG